MDTEKSIQLYDLLNDFVNYANECKESEIKEEVLFEIKKAIISAETIREILALSF